MKTQMSLLQDYACYQMIHTKILFLHNNEYIVRTEGAKYLCDILEIPYKISPKYSDLMTYPSDFLCESIMRIACIRDGIRNGPLEPDYDLRFLVALISHLPHFASCFMDSERGISSILPSMSSLWIMPQNIKIGHSMTLDYPFANLKVHDFNAILNSHLMEYLANIDAEWYERIKNTYEHIYTKKITQTESLWMMCLMAGLLPEEEDIRHMESLPPLTNDERANYVIGMIEQVSASSLTFCAMDEIPLNV